jgi:hypothetical protein
MDATAASLIGTAIGAISGLGGGYLAGRRQTQLEREKWVRSRNDEHEKTLRLALAELTRKLAAGTHAIAWLTWKAKYASTELTEGDLSVYNKDMKALFPDIVGSRIVVVALDKEIHTKITPLILNLYSLDAQVARAGMLFKGARSDCIKAIAQYYEAVLEFDKELLTKVTETMGLDEAKV